MLVDSTNNLLSFPVKEAFVGLPNFHCSSSVGGNQSIHSASLSMGSMNEMINSMVVYGSLVFGWSRLY